MNIEFRLENDVLILRKGNVPIMSIPLSIGQRTTVKTNQNDILYIVRHAKEYLTVSVCKKGLSLKRVYSESNIKHYAVFRDEYPIMFEDSNENNRKLSVKKCGLEKRLRKLGFIILNEKSFVFRDVSVKILQSNNLRRWTLLDGSEVIGESVLFTEDFEDFVIKYLDKKGYLS